MIQLPNDVILKGNTQVGRFEFKQVFYSPSNDFMGTEDEFVKAGLAYHYEQLDKHRRVEIENPNK